MLSLTNHAVQRGHQRPAEPLKHQSKRARRAALTLNQLDDGLLSKILGYLSHSQQQPLQTVCKAFSKAIWKQRKIAEDIDFYWNDCTFPCVEKGSYCLSKATFAMVDLFAKHSPTQNMGDFIQQCHSFGSITRMSAAFHAFAHNEIAHALRKYQNFLTSSAPELLILPEWAIANSWRFQPLTAGGGERLVYALMKLREIGMGDPLAYTHFAEAAYQAIEHQATCVSDLAMQLLGPNGHIYHFKQFALASAEKGDYKALDRYYSAGFAVGQDSNPPYNVLPPVLFALAKAHTDPKRAEALYERALQGYKQKAPASHLIYAARCKMQLNKHLEAEPLLNRSIKLLGHNTPPQLLLSTARLQLSIQHHSQAQDVINRFVATNELSFCSAKQWAEAGFIASKLANWEQAALLYKKAVSAFEDNAPLAVLEQASTAFAQVQDYVSILDLYKTVERDPKHLLASTLLVNTACALFVSQQPERAAAVYEQAIASFGSNVKTLHLLRAAKLHVHLENWHKATFLLNHYYQRQRPQAEQPSIANLLIIALSNLKMGNWGKAAEHYNHVLTLDPQVSVEVLYCAFIANREAENYRETGLLLERFKNCYVENAIPIPLALIADEARLKLKLEEFAAAALLYEQILLLERAIAPTLLADAALAHYRSGNLPRAEHLYACAEKAFGALIPQKVLEQAAQVSYTQQHWRRAHTLFSKLSAACNGLPEHLVIPALHSLRQYEALNKQ